MLAVDIVLANGSHVRAASTGSYADLYKVRRVMFRRLKGQCLKQKGFVFFSNERSLSKHLEGTVMERALFVKTAFNGDDIHRPTGTAIASHTLKSHRAI